MGLERVCAHFARMPDRSGHHVGSCLHCLASASPRRYVVTTQDEVTRYLAALNPAPERGSEPPVFIPTGLYIESIQFKGPYDVQVSIRVCLAALRERSA
jgi:hypothetical protein